MNQLTADEVLYGVKSVRKPKGGRLTVDDLLEDNNFSVAETLDEGRNELSFDQVVKRKGGTMYDLVEDGEDIYIERPVKGRGKPSKRKPTKAHKDHVDAVMVIYGMDKDDAEDICYECEEMVKIKGGSFWSWLGNAAANVGKAVANMIPGVGAYAAEGIDALQHHRKYDALKATKNAAINVATSFLPPGIKQAANFGIKKVTGGKKKSQDHPNTIATMEKKTRKKPVFSERTKLRQQLVSRLMKKKGLTLGQASKRASEIMKKM